MKPDPLDDVLSSYAKQPVPARANVTHAEIWSAIEARRCASTGWREWFAFTEITELLARPSLALPLFAFAALMGVVPAAVVARIENESVLATHSIHFEAFSVRTIGMVLAQPPATELER